MNPSTKEHECLWEKLGVTLSLKSDLALRLDPDYQDPLETLELGLHNPVQVYQEVQNIPLDLKTTHNQ